MSTTKINFDNLPTNSFYSNESGDFCLKTTASNVSHVAIATAVTVVAYRVIRGKKVDGSAVESRMESEA